MEECRKYPNTEFIVANNDEEVQPPMVCPICKLKYNEANGLVDTRKPKAKPKGLVGFIRTEIFGGN